MDEKIETRKEAEETINALYGLDKKFVMAVIEELGFDALSDEGIILLAQMQDSAEKSAWGVEAG